MTARPVLTGLIFMAAAMAAGCGSSDSSSMDSSSSFKQDFASQAPRLEALWNETDSVVLPPKSRSDAQVATTARSLADRADTELAKLDQLDPPSGAQDDFNALKSSLTSVEDDLLKLSSVTSGGYSVAAAQLRDRLVGDSQQVANSVGVLKDEG